MNRRMAPSEGGGTAVKLCFSVRTRLARLEILGNPSCARMLMFEGRDAEGETYDVR